MSTYINIYIYIYIYIYNIHMLNLYIIIYKCTRVRIYQHIKAFII